MKHIISAFSIALWIGVMGSSCGSDTYDFRDDYRPVYDRTMTPELLASLKAKGEITLIDVRLAEDYQAHPSIIEGSTYLDPENIVEWSAELPRDKPVVGYCLRGKWVSQKASTFLKEKGFDVYSLEGGIVGWEKDFPE